MKNLTFLIIFSTFLWTSGLSQQVNKITQYPFQYAGAKVSLKTAPIRYIYGPNFEIETRINNSFSAIVSFQRYNRDFSSPKFTASKQTNVESLLSNFSLFKGDGFQGVIGGRYYLMAEKDNHYRFYLEARLRYKEFSYDDSLSSSIDPSRPPQDVYYQEYQVSRGTQIIWGFKRPWRMFNESMIGEFEIYLGAGYYEMTRKYETTEVNSNGVLNVERSQVTEALPQLLFGLNLGLGY